MSIANYLTALDAQRDQLACNLVTMGVQASESEKLNTLVPKVLQIPSGRPEVTLFCNGNDALTTYGESIYTFLLTDTAALLALLMCIRISAARRTPMHFTTISLTSTGALSFTPCVSLRYASRLQAGFCSPISPVRPMQAKCGLFASRHSSFRLRRLQGTFTKRSAAERQFPFRSAGSARSATSSPFCTTAAAYLLTTIISLGKR